MGKSEPQMFKQLIIPDSDVQISVFKTHMAISQIESDITGTIGGVASRCVILSCTVLLKLSLIAPTIRDWIAGCPNMWQECSNIGEKQIKLGGCLYLSRI